MQITNATGKGSFTHILAINAKCQIRCINPSDDDKHLKVELLDEKDSVLAVLYDNDISAKSDNIIDLCAKTSQKINVTADDEVYSLISKTQEITIGKGVLSQSIKEYVGDGVNTEYFLGENAPANNSLEVRIIIDSIFEASYIDDWEFNDDQSAVIFNVAPYNGADIKLELNKWE